MAGRNANEDVLSRMAAAGDNLSCPRDVEFTVVFRDEKVAEQFANQFRSFGYRASLEFSETVDGFPWDVIVMKHMVPTSTEIGDFETVLQNAADAFGGHNDGWGCFSEPGKLIH